MIKVLIVEDEMLAAQRLSKLLKEAEPDVQIEQICDSIESTVKYLTRNQAPDLMMLDIQLGDGISFDIFKTINLTCPVIFTTAYDEYAIKAFELNSIDYLLKPIRPEALIKSINKFKKLSHSSIDRQLLTTLLDKEQRNYKQRFLVYAGENLISVKTTEIAYFYSIEKSTFLTTIHGRSYALEFSLDKLEETLNPLDFFRINRQFLISFSSIKKISIQSKSRIKLTIDPLPKDEILVSSARTHEFREWLDR